jgi:hypothetical protein
VLRCALLLCRRGILLQRRFNDLQVEDFGNIVKLVNDAPQRWSSACKVFERVLQLWDLLKRHYEKNEPADKLFPLLEEYELIRELYSLMLPIKDVIVATQATAHPAGTQQVQVCSSIGVYMPIQ